MPPHPSKPLSRSRWYVHTKRGKEEPETKSIPTLYDYYMSLMPSGGPDNRSRQADEQDPNKIAIALPPSRETARWRKKADAVKAKKNKKTKGEKINKKNLVE
jgi:hypothetical protein